MSLTEKVDTFVVNLNGQDLKSKHITLMEIHDSFESFAASNDYGYFLEQLVPKLLFLLDTIPINFTTMSAEHKIRNSVIELFIRVICNKTFAPFALKIMDKMLKVLKTDNEDNGVLSMKVINNLHKAYKSPSFLEKIQPFMDIINEIYSNMKTIIPESFKDHDGREVDLSIDSASSPQPSTVNSNESQLKHLLPSMKSFRTLAEFPIIFVSLITCYSQLLTTTLPKFTPILIEFLQLQVESQKIAREEAAKKGKIYTSVTPEIKNRALYGDFIISQVKATSFLAYILIRGHMDSTLKKDGTVVPDIIMRLLQDCPSELSSARKELLHATRHILSTPCKPFFLPKIDLLFNEKVLLGDGYTSYQTLRPLAYSTAADFLHNIRNELTADQVRKVVMMYSRLIQDVTIVPTVQILSAKLLLNLLERVNKLPKVEARRLCFIIIEAYTNRFASLNSEFESIAHREKQYHLNVSKKTVIFDTYRKINEDISFEFDGEVKVLNNEELDINEIINKEIGISKIDEDVEMKVDENNGIDDDYELTIFDLQYEYPIQITEPPTSDPMKDARYLFRTLLNFLKTVMLLLRQTNPSPPTENYNSQGWDSAARIFKTEEVDILRKLLKESIESIKFFQNPKYSELVSSNKSFDIRQPNLPISASKDEKEMMEIIAAMFSKIDLSTFNEILSLEIGFLVNKMVDYAPLLHLAHFFLGSESTSGNFMSILLGYLKSKLEILKDANVKLSHVFLRLLKLCLLSLNLYPNVNDLYISKHLKELILNSLKLSTTAKDPTIYFYLIRTLFKSINGDKFQSVNKEVLPLLPNLLKTLSQLLETARTPQEKDVCIELCLAIPVKVERLVMYLHYLVKPVALSLNGPPELISQGLKMLELWIDTITAEFLDPILEPHIEEIMRSLWKLLKPLPFYHAHSHTVARILGKLGGRNRSFIKPVSDLEHQSVLHQRLEILLQVNHLETEEKMSISNAVELAIEILEDPRQDLDEKTITYYRINAFKYLSSIFKLFIDAKDVPNNYDFILQEGINFLLKDEPQDPKPLVQELVIDARKLNNQEELSEKMLNAIFYAVSIDELESEVTELIENICSHFVQLYVAKHIIKRRKNDKSFSVNDGEGKVFINEHILLNNILYALSSNHEKVRTAGINALKNICELGVVLFGSLEKSLNFILLRSLLVEFFHACYDELYYNKAGGVLGLKVLIQDVGIPIKWFSKFQVELIRALFFVLRDTAENVPTIAVTTSVDLIKIISKGCNTEAKEISNISESLIASLLYDLANPKKIIRNTAKEVLEILADSTGKSIFEIISLSKTILLNPVFSKPLRALPLHMQIGNIEAIKFWLTIAEDVSTFNDELNRLLKECLTILNSEDKMIVNEKRLNEHYLLEQLVELRVSCISLLNIVISKPDEPLLPRTTMLPSLFKALCAEDHRIIDASYQALKVALAENSKLPKNLLHNGLRPMLMNLADHKSLTVTNLDALAKLLVLLISYFKVEVGNKLMDHLKAWATPAVLHQISGQDLNSNGTVQVVCAILNIFHLLPPKALIFIPDILKILDYLENNLRRYQNSPFRVPIAEFLNRFHQESFNYFFERFNVRQERLEYFIKNCSHLKDDFKGSLNKLIELVKSENNFAIKVIKFVNLMDVILAIDETDEDWLNSQELVVKDLFELSKEIIKNDHEENKDQKFLILLTSCLRKFQQMLVKQLNNSKDIELLISYLEFTCEEDLILSKVLDYYVFEKIIKSKDVEFRQKILLKCVELFLNFGISFKFRIHLFRKLFNPILIIENSKEKGIKKLCETNNGSLAPWLNLVHNKIWKSSNPLLMAHVSGQIDHFRIELLQMTSILVSMGSTVIESLRKDVIRFSWSFNKLDDSITKTAAYLTSCYFINSYATPIKIRTNMLVALLRDNNNDTKFLVKKSLDLLAPVMGDTDDKGEKDITWLKYPRRVISENSFTINNIVSVFKFIVRHKDLFFQARDQFIGISINAMGKLTILQNTSTDNQSLAMDIAELILYWEEKKNSLKEKETAKETSNNNQNDYSTPISYVIPFGQKEAFITFLIRYVCINTQKSSNNEMGERALNVLNILLGPGYWSDVKVKLSFFDKFLIEPDFNNSNNGEILLYCINSLEVLSVVLEHKSTEWIIENLTGLQNLLEKSIRSDNHDVQEALQKVLNPILRAIKKETDDDEEFEQEEVKAFLNLLTSVISDDFSSTSSVAAGVTLCWVVANYKPERLNSLLTVIMRTFSKLCKDHVNITQPIRDQNSKQAEEIRMTTKLLDRILCFSAIRISHLGDQRRNYLSLLAQLIEKTSDFNILSKVLKIVYGFIFNKDNIFPTSKEKAAILGKMMGFESRSELPKSLANNFYRIIIKIFEDENFNYSDLTQRLEQPFLMGTKFSDIGIRSRFMKILHDSIEDDIEKRLNYIAKMQNWYHLADYPWLIQATELLFGSIKFDQRIQLTEDYYKFAPLDYLKETFSIDEDKIVEDNNNNNDNSNNEVHLLISKHKKFLKDVRSINAGNILKPLIEISRFEPREINSIFAEIFPIAFKTINDKMDFSKSFCNLITKDYHLRQVSIQPNVIQGLLMATEKCSTLYVPPQIVKYLGSTYNCYYPALKIISRTLDSDNQLIKEVSQDAYCEILSKLEEPDLFYGLWKQRSTFQATKSALSFEQIGMYDKALQFYETAQIEARNGLSSYSNAEYALWEDNWISCSEKLQQWDVLAELAKNESYVDLLLECVWRRSNWSEDKLSIEQSLNSVITVPTARRHFFKSFLAFQGLCQQENNPTDVIKIFDEGIQILLSKWSSLPTRPTQAHITLLHSFQQYVELSEATKIYSSLIATNVQNSDSKLIELQKVLYCWRERLPNIYDNINIWNDLCTQRLHVYNSLSVLNRPFMSGGSNNGNNNSHGLRGFHETAFMINRFAQVARKHHLTEVCITELSKIYSLPNIEISEAFIKLTEQIKCHYENPNELNTGLDVLINTNLGYFNNSQKSEFLTLKGMIQSKLNAFEEANHSFATAINYDRTLPIVWAEWGFFNYKLFKQASSKSNQNQVELMKYASLALTCFLNAAGIYKNGKSRRCLALILWLLTLDDSNRTLIKEFSNYKGEIPIWYWITFIPQLLTSLSHKEGKIMRDILVLIGKNYPQALHFNLRTTKEDFQIIQKQWASKKNNNNEKSEKKVEDDKTVVKKEEAKENFSETETTKSEIKTEDTKPTEIKTEDDAKKSVDDKKPESLENSQPWEYVESIMLVLKTSYPLLALSLELMVDQITRFKSNADEDAYRLVVALLTDGMGTYGKMVNSIKENSKLPSSMETNISKFANTVLPKTIRIEFEKDLIESKPTFLEYIKKLIKWKERLENKLDRKFNKINLENLCPHLTEFHHQKFEGIELPGQYLSNFDNHNQFIKIERFLPTLIVERGFNSCYKIIQIRGNDGSINKFFVQFPANRHSRREERTFQLFRIINDLLNHKIQSRSRNIKLTIPLAIPLSPHIRILKNQSNDINLFKIYEEYCSSKNQEIEEPFFHLIEKLKEDKNLNEENILKEIQLLYCPKNLVESFFNKLFEKFEDYFIFKKQFICQYSSFIFMTYMMSITSRQPQKIHIDLNSGNIWTSEMLINRANNVNLPEAFKNSLLNPAFQKKSPMIYSNEIVPFRLTPNIENFMGIMGMDGLLSVFILIISKSLLEKENELEHYLYLFIQNEISSWFNQQLRSNFQGPLMREIVRVNCDLIVNNLQKLSEIDNNLATENVNQLILKATDSKNLSKMESLWRPYL